MKTKTALIMALALAIFSGCETKQETSEAAVSKPVKVSIAEVQAGNNDVLLKYSGSIEPSLTIPLSFRTTGTVESVLVEAGDYVKKDQLLATVDNTDAQNMVDMTQSKYQQALDAYNRLKSVHDNGSLPEIKWVEMETNLEQAKTSLALAKNNLDKCNLYAPLSGIIGQRNIEPGMSSLSIASAPLEIVELGKVKIKIAIPENEIAKMKKGLEATITVSALNGKQYQGKVTDVSPVADKISRTYTTKIEVANPGMELKPGMVCDVSIQITSDEQLTLIPYQAVSKDSEGNAYVYLVDKTNKVAHKQTVSVGNYFGDYIEVLTGLKSGQTIVSNGINKISDNCLITW